MTGFCYPGLTEKGGKKQKNKKKQAVLKLLGGVASLQTNAATERNYAEKVRGEGGEKKANESERFWRLCFTGEKQGGKK